MKTLILLLSLLFCFAADVKAQGGSGLGPQADTVALRIARKMKDSLDLTGEQRNQIYHKNVWIHNRKDSLRQIYPLGSDSLRIKIQRVERRRDSLYLPILGPEKYLLYLQKKSNLVSAN